MNFFDLILAPFLHFIAFVFGLSFRLTQNYGWAIVMLSFAVSLVLLPVFVFIEKARKKDNALKLKMKPQMDEIKRVYKGQERYYYLKTLNRQHQYSPLRALIPILSLLLQIPFFIAAYQFLEHFEPLRGVSFLFIPDLSLPDRFWGTVNILPLAMTLVNLITAFFYTRFSDKNERRQMLVVAGLFLVLLFKLPAGLVLYWTMNNIFSFLRLMVTNIEVFKHLNLSYKIRTINTHALRSKFVENLKNTRLLTGFAVAYLLLTFLLQKDALNALSTTVLQTVIALLLLINLAYFWAIKPETRITKLINAVLWFFEGLFILLWFIHKVPLNYLYLKLMLISIQLIHFGFFNVISHQKNTDLKPARPKEHSGLMIQIIDPLLFIILTAGITPLVIYLSSPDDFYGRVSHLLYKQLIIFILFVVITLAANRLLKKRKLLLNKGIATLSLIFVLFGFIYQKNLGIMRGYRLINENLLELNPWTVWVDLALILGSIYLIDRFYQKYKPVLWILLLSVIFIESKPIYLGIKEQLQVEKKEYAQAYPEPEIAKERLEKQFALAKDKQNILVFVLDGLPGFIFDELLNETPEYFELFDGFTFYKNTISCGSFTFPSVSGLIGGHTRTIAQLNKDSENTFRDKISTTLFNHRDTFVHAGYSAYYHKIPYFLNENTTFDSAQYQLFKANIIERDDLFAYRTHYVPDYATAEAKDAFLNIPLVKMDYGLLIRLSLFKIAPYVLKKYVYTKHLEASDSKSIKNTEARIVSAKWRYRVTDSYWSSVAPLINKQSDKPTIKVLWTKTMCRRYHLNEQFGPPVQEIRDKKFNGFSREEGKISTRYFVAKLSEVFTKLKALDLYHNTTIILVSDHGVHYSNSESWDEMAIKPILMVKENNASGKLKISDQLMSNADVYAITTQIATGQSLDVIESPIKTDKPRELYYWSCDHGDKNTLDEKQIDIHFGIRLKTGDNIYDKATWDTVYLDNLQ